MELQKQFVQSVRLFFKERGEAWLNQLPELILYCEQKWSMKMEEAYSLSVNYVAPAKMDNGREVVVKICISSEGFLDELEALRLFGEKGIVQLVDSDLEKGIILLERLSPGHTLAELDDHDEACRIAAEVVRNLSIPAPPETRIPTVKVREESLREIVKRHKDGFGPISIEVLERALKIFTYMNETTEKRLLLHGDFHHYNVLSSGEGVWTAIDPKGLIGEIEYDLIQYMLNKLPDQGAYEVIEKRADTFTEELNLNRERLLLWGYCHTVVATAWSVDDDGSYCESFYQGIEIFEKLYETHYGAIIDMK
ncbi:aminoglycoside phosphotransferase family protein [Alkalihalobacillus sp. AL-G]|uniref:aminoglycoside phosphotransferase family protein n=1 Tax=Alkalihalobacillus sp. AL-G TaxID=2926399 RepID=UPI00272C6677|nr:aminoglycoside phosphotransferase family protein [Alkalihalobacillus sp. AL-G]WLD93864.1 aminoglycoside phosphotransferase family protein [Alkalihalobacillus sp. AL-G]